MSKVKPWARPLQVPDSTYNKWARQAPPEDNFTFWCIKTGKLDENQYLKWAREHYGLASLEPSFFDTCPHSELWQKVSPQGQWNENLIPIGEWEGVIFIACIEPPAEKLWNFPVHYILAPASGLSSTWQQFQQSSATMQSNPNTDKKINPQPLTTTTDLLDDEGTQESLLLDLPDSEKNSSLLLELEGLDSSVTKEFSEQTEKANKDNDRWALDMDMNNSATILQEITELSDVNKINDISGASDGDNVKGIDDANNVSDASTFTLSSTLNKYIEGTQFSKTLNQDNIPTVVIEAAKLKEKKAKATARIVDNKKKQHTAEIQPQPPPQPQTQPPQPPKPQTETTSDGLPESPTGVAAATNEDQVATWIFKQMKDKFEKSMILLFEDNKLQPWKWDKEWTLTDPKGSQPFDVSKTCVFRVVYRTRLPYHGYVVRNEINEVFFSQWGHPELPQHITICPIQQDSHLVGMLLSVGDKNCETQQHLIFAERQAKQLSEAIQRIHLSVA